LVEYLKHLLAKGMAFLKEKQIDPEAIKTAEGFDKVALLDDAVEKLLESEETKKAFLNLARATSRVYRAILPDTAAHELAPDAVLLSVLAQKIQALEPEVDISQVMQAVDDLLDQSVAPVPYVIEETDAEKFFDLSQIDFEKLKERFSKGKKRTEAEKLRALLNQKLERMVAKNPTRTDFMEKLQELIEKYNSGSLNIEAFFQQLMAFTEALQEEDQRAIREGLTEEELALFDIITKPAPEMTDKEVAQVKAMCRELLETLKEEKLVLDWRKKAKAKGDVRRTLEIVFNAGLPESFDEDVFNEKCEAAFHHLMSSYYGGGQSIYASAGMF
jgi:type I restriction enzyme R subunit